jgi:hypothetical protein
MSSAIEGLKSLTLAELQNHLGARHPIRAFGMNQMVDDIERAPGVFTFISQRPPFRQIAQKRIEGGGGASEQRHYFLQIVFHTV